MTTGAHKDREPELAAGLSAYEAENGALPGISIAAWRSTLIAQMVSSLRRIEFIRIIGERNLSSARIDPHSSNFDPIRAAILKGKKGEIDEAVWLVFIATHFGKHEADGWKLAANVMGSFGAGPIWTAEAYGQSPDGFLHMLKSHEAQLQDMTQAGRYSNHRQYQSRKPASIARIFQSFYEWHHQCGTFRDLLQSIHAKCGQESTSAFDGFYASMKVVHGFGRLGSFDFLTMLGKTQLAPIEPGSVYFVGATGPLRGAKLLFHGDRDYSVKDNVMEAKVDELDDFLKTGKQVLEDSLCNWQKRPDQFTLFRG